MTNFKLLGAAAVLCTALAAPVMAQEVVQEPGQTGFNYPNSRYVTGGYGQRTPWNRDRYPRLPYGGVIAYDAAPGFAVGVGPVGVRVGPSPYDAYAYDPY